jgi:hypothetical protein
MSSLFSSGLQISNICRDWKVQFQDVGVSGETCNPISYKRVHCKNRTRPSFAEKPRIAKPRPCRKQTNGRPVLVRIGRACEYQTTQWLVLLSSSPLELRDIHLKCRRKGCQSSVLRNICSVLQLFHRNNTDKKFSANFKACNALISMTMTSEVQKCNFFLLHNAFHHGSRCRRCRRRCKRKGQSMQLHLVDQKQPLIL